MKENIENRLIHGKKMIDTVDLSAVVERLTKIEKWKTCEALEACQQYRNFLYLKLKYNNQYELPPSYDMDEAWHAHILHTEDYMKFCDEAFGYYLHHHPQTRKGGTLTAEDLAELFEKETQRLHYQEFGEYIYAVRPNYFIQKIAIFIRDILTLKVLKRVSV